MTDNITLTDNEREALEALWRAGGEMNIPHTDTVHVLRLAYHELAKINTYTWLVYITAEGRALAIELFTPPLTMPTTADAVRAWLEARGLWAEGCKVRTDGNGDLLYVVTSPVVSVALYHATSNRFVPCVDRLAIEDDAAEAQFRAEFDRACDIARALNANRERSE